MSTDAAIFLSNFRRFSTPLHDAVPFALMPVGEMPLCEHIVRILAGQRISRIFLVVDDHAPQVEEALGYGGKWGVELRIVQERKFSGVFEGLRRLRNDLSGRILVLPMPLLAEIPLARLEEKLAEKKVGAVFAQDGERNLEYFLMQTAALGRNLGRAAQNSAEARAAADAAGVPVTTFATRPLAHLPVRCLADYWQANRLLLDGRLPFLFPGGSSRGAGLLVSGRASVASGARLIPPILLAPGCKVASGCTIGPYAVIGEKTFIDSGAKISGSIVLKEAYIGPNTTVENALVFGSLLIRHKTGLTVTVPDPFLLGHCHVGRRRTRLASALTNRLLGLLGAAIFSPALLALYAADRLRPERGLLRSRECATCVTCPQLVHEADFECVSLHEATTGNAFLDRLPGLLDVIAGRVHLVGVEPLPPEEAAQINEEWQRPRFTVPAGLIQPWHALKAVRPDFEEKRVMENFYAHSKSPCEDLNILLKSLRAALRR